MQRRRWANGGLLILPKFWKQLGERRFQRQPIRLREVLLRVNYMASIAWASFGLVFLLAYPYDSRLLSPLIFAAALPYFLCMGSDLRDCGHRFSDIFRIYGFNLVLLPVNLAGVLKSVQQAFTGDKIPFVRTPKVRDRTASPGLYVVVPYLIVAFSLVTLWRDVLRPELGQRRVRRAQRHPGHLRHPRLHRHQELVGGHVVGAAQLAVRRPQGEACPEGGAGPGNARKHGLGNYPLSGRPAVEPGSARFG